MNSSLQRPSEKLRFWMLYLYEDWFFLLLILIILAPFCMQDGLRICCNEMHDLMCRFQFTNGEKKVNSKATTQEADGQA